MRLLSVLPAFGLVLSLGAASPWEDFLQRRAGQNPRLAAWTLCVRQGDFTSSELLGDVVFQKLLIGGDLKLETLGAAEARDLWSQQSWGNRPHWALLAPSGDLAATVSGPVQGEAVRDAIRMAGGLPRWEQRAAFLKEHPDQGEARLEEASMAFRLLRVRLADLDRQGRTRVPAWHREEGARVSPARLSLPPGPTGEALADELYPDLVKALEALFRVPGWDQALPFITAQLSMWDLSQSSAMRKLFSQAADSAEGLLRQDPYSYDLANFWVEARDAAGQAPVLLGGRLTPVPGRVWPSSIVINRLLEPYRRRQDWEGALRCLADLTPTNRPEPLTARSWDDYCRIQCSLLIQKGLALASQGAWDLAGGALEDARQWGGSQGVREALVMRGSQLGGNSSELDAWRNLLSEALSRSGDRPAAPAAEPPLRLLVLGNPGWIVKWSALHQSQELAPWSPGELRWEVASKPLQEQLHAQFHWHPGPRWALFRGEELRATGESCPSATALANTLELEGPSLLQRYDRVVGAQPDHLAARRARFALLLKRMPDKRLEGILASDAAAARVALDFDPSAAWKPDRDIWATAAQQVLPKVEEELKAWPSRTALWNVWISWSRFHPSEPSIVALAQSLPYWSPQGDWRAWLPYSVQRAVAGELRRRGSFDIMRNWYRAAWDLLDQRPLASLRYGERSWVLERRREEETAVFQPLREALRALQCNQELVELERVFSAMMGQDMSRRR